MMISQPFVVVTSPTWVTVTVPELSVAMTELGSGGGTSPKHWKVLLEGQVIIGGTGSEVLVTTKVRQFVTAVHKPETVTQYFPASAGVIFVRLRQLFVCPAMIRSFRDHL